MDLSCESLLWNKQVIQTITEEEGNQAQLWHGGMLEDTVDLFQYHRAPPTYQEVKHRLLFQQKKPIACTAVAPKIQSSLKGCMRPLGLRHYIMAAIRLLHLEGKQENDTMSTNCLHFNVFFWKDLFTRRIPKWMNREKTCWFWPWDSNRRNAEKLHSQGRVWEKPAERREMPWSTVDSTNMPQHAGTPLVTPAAGGWRDTTFLEQGDRNVQQPESLLILPEGEPCRTQLWVWPGGRVGGPPSSVKGEHIAYFPSTGQRLPERSREKAPS